jgi:hypothetical protein
MAKEEWQDPDSGYLNCIGVGDTYVKKQMERILNNNLLNCSMAVTGHITCFGRDTKENIK